MQNVRNSCVPDTHHFGLQVHLHLVKCEQVRSVRAVVINTSSSFEEIGGATCNSRAEAVGALSRTVGKVRARGYHKVGGAGADPLHHCF